MKATVVLCGLILSAFLVSLPVQAAVVTVDVTTKAVNPQARGITVVYRTELGEKTIELDVSRKAEITVNGKGGTLDSLGPGMEAKVSYDKDLAIVTKIDARGTATATKQPELVEVSELNDETNNDHPWISEDGLTIYWDRSAGPGAKASIWMAHREKPESPFDNKRSLFSGKYPTVSSDGLEMILVGDRTDGGQGMSLRVATKKALDQPFGRPKEIDGLQSHNAGSPCLSSDGLTLYFGSRSQNSVVYCTREDKESPWSKAKVYDAPGFEQSDLALSLITPDGLTLFGHDTFKQGAWKPSLMMLSRSSTKRPFKEPQRIEFDNRPLYGVWPRYVPATHELFFARISLKDGRYNKDKPVGIWVVKNFSPSDVK